MLDHKLAPELISWATSCRAGPQEQEGLGTGCWPQGSRWARHVPIGPPQQHGTGRVPRRTRPPELISWATSCGAGPQGATGPGTGRWALRKQPARALQPVR